MNEAQKELQKAHEAKIQRILTTKWAIAAQTNHLGNMCFGVMLDTKPPQEDAFVINLPSVDIAMHIVDIHNASITDDIEAPEPDESSEDMCTHGKLHTEHCYSCDVGDLEEYDKCSHGNNPETCYECVDLGAGGIDQP